MNATETRPDVSAALEKLSQQPLGKIKVFVVEDDAMIREMIISKLTASGCIPYSTGDGQEAIAMAEQFIPNVIILDLMLPGLSGEEVLSALKEKDELKHIPVIIFSNKNQEAVKRKVFDLGADRYFVKAATDLSTLVNEIQILANKK